jgi:hypothetical protein
LGRLSGMSVLRTLSFLAALSVTGACSPAPQPTPTLSPTATTPATPTTGPSPTPSPSPSATPVGQVFTQADFTRSGGCGDVYMWAATEADTMAVTMQWDAAATSAWDGGDFNDTATMPADGISVSLVVGQNLSAGFCTDIGGQSRVDGNAPAVSGTVELLSLKHK